MITYNLFNMVRYRPNPLGMEGPELFRWQSTLGPFRKIGFWFAYHRYFDYFLKTPFPALLIAAIGIGGSTLIYKFSTTYDAPSENPLMNQVTERLFEHSQWASDSRKTRGEWNSNFNCWSDSPDCGKDYKKRYFS